MQRLLLGFLLLCPAITAADTDLAQTWRKVNSYRVTSGVKSVVQGVLGVYACKTGWDHVSPFADHVGKVLHGESIKNHYKQIGKNGVIAGGMLHTSYLLFCYAWENAKHALAIK